jgi:hypothetical protein
LFLRSIERGRCILDAILHTGAINPSDSSGLTPWLNRCLFRATMTEDLGASTKSGGWN